MSNKFDTGDGEDADYFVCVPLTSPLKFPDNLVSTCSKCGKSVQHRPIHPKTPKKICMPCAMPEMEIRAMSDDLHVQVRPEAMDEVMAYFKKGLN